MEQVKELLKLYEIEKSVFSGEEYTVEEAIRSSRVIMSKNRKGKFLRVIPVESFSYDFLATIIEAHVDEHELENHAMKAGPMFLEYVERESVDSWMKTTPLIKRVQQLDDFNGVIFEYAGFKADVYLDESYLVLPTEQIYDTLIERGRKAC